MKTRYIFLAIAALVLSACAKNTQPTEPEGIQMTFTAYQEGSEMTRTTVQSGGTQVYWEPSDEIKVFFNGSSGRFVSQNTENASVATFTGTLNVIVGATEGAGYSTQTWGLYPYRADAVLDGDAMVTTLPASQTGRAGSFAKNTNITVAQSNGYGLAFYNVCGGVRFSLTQEGIKRVTFEGNNEETIAGKIKVAFADGIPVVQEISEGEKMITLTAPNGGTFQTGQWYYISAIPGSLPSGYKMVFYKASESAKLTSSSSVTFKRGIFGSLADADEDLIFKPTGGDEPNPDDFIQFEDPIAKYACVEKFDKNGDGEISYAEAAAVNSLEGLFDNRKTIVSFDEIKYFTNATTLGGAFTQCTQLKSITIPNNFSSNWLSGEFEGCRSLSTIVLPDNLKHIPLHCFLGCTKLERIELPETIVSIGSGAFSSCSTLKEIIIPSGVTLDDYVFSNCSSLSKVVLPDSMETIPEHTFSDCSSLESVTFPKNLRIIKQYAFANCPFKYYSDGPNCIVIPDGVISIEAFAFNCGARDIIINGPSLVSFDEMSFVPGYTRVFVQPQLVDLYKKRINNGGFKMHLMSKADYPLTGPIAYDIPEAIDLGLSVKWASFNVGATAPEENGFLYYWGDIESPWMQSGNHAIPYKYFNGSTTSIIKYNTLSQYGIVDNLTSLEKDDDAAYVHYGDNWRMPSYTEILELTDTNNCTWEWISLNGVAGAKVISKKMGYEGNFIFLPEPSALDHHYWTLSLPYSYPYNAYRLSFQSGDVNTYNGTLRVWPGVIRAVCP